MANHTDSTLDPLFKAPRTSGLQVYVVDNDHGRRAQIAYALSNQGIFATPAEDVTQIDRLASAMTLIIRHDDLADHEREIAQFKSANPKAILVLYSTDAKLRNAVRSIRAGALDYFCWPDEKDGLVASVLSLGSISDHLQGRPPKAAPAPAPMPTQQGFSAVTILDTLIDGWHSDRRRKDSASQRVTKLTEREREILGMLSRGMSSAQIAEKLRISPRTVETHRANILTKIDVRSTAEAVRYAIESGVA